MNNIIRHFKIRDLKKINAIYKASFPKEERFSPLLVGFNILLKKATIFVIEVDGVVRGFINLFFYRNNVFILFLAIEQDYRNQGYGSKILNWCLDKYADYHVYVDIEELNKNVEDYNIRERRCNFYLRNKFYLTGYMGHEKSGTYYILANYPDFDLVQYCELDRNIAAHFLYRHAILEKIKTK